MLPELLAGRHAARRVVADRRADALDGARRRRPAHCERRWERLATGPASSRRTRTAWWRCRCSRRSPSSRSSRRTTTGDRLVGMFAGAVGRGRIDKVVLARRVDLRLAGRARRAERPAPARRERPGEHDVRVPPRRPDVPGRDAGAARPAPTAGRSGPSRSPARSGVARDADRGRPARAASCSPPTRTARSTRSWSTCCATCCGRSRRGSTIDPEPARHDAALRPAPRHRDRRHAPRAPTGSWRWSSGCTRRRRSGGEPRDVALALLDEHEGFDRGWYAGPVGWLGADGDGEFVVALRCGIVDRTRATLFAGCGIVADSDPDREWEESRIKLRAVVGALGRPGGRAR